MKDAMIRYILLNAMLSLGMVLFCSTQIFGRLTEQQMSLLSSMEIRYGNQERGMRSDTAIDSGKEAYYVKCGVIHCNMDADMKDFAENKANTAGITGNKADIADFMENKVNTAGITGNKADIADFIENKANTAAPAGNKADTVDFAGNKADIADSAGNKADTVDFVGNKADTADLTEKNADKINPKEDSFAEKNTKDSYSAASASENSMRVFLNKEDYQCLLKIVEAEAGVCDEKGKILVANVVLNRMEDAAFPDTVKGVVYQNHQFSPVANGTIDQVEISKETEQAVARALTGEDYSQGALYFAARKLSDKDNMDWFDRNLCYLFEHDGHEFFKEKN